MLPTFEFLVKIDEIYVTSQHFGEMSETSLTKLLSRGSLTYFMQEVPEDAMVYLWEVNHNSLLKELNRDINRDKLLFAPVFQRSFILIYIGPQE